MLQVGTCFITSTASVVIDDAPLFEVCWCGEEVIGRSEEETDSQGLHVSKGITENVQHYKAYDGCGWQ